MSLNSAHLCSFYRHLETPSFIDIPRQSFRNLPEQVLLQKTDRRNYFCIGISPLGPGGTDGAQAVGTVTLGNQAGGQSMLSQATVTLPKNSDQRSYLKQGFANCGGTSQVVEGLFTAVPQV